MQIYTGQCFGEKKEKCKKYDLGFMLSSCVSFDIKKDFVGMKNYCLDNGAFSAWSNGYPFLELPFLKSISLCMRYKIELNFIVLPDLIGQKESTEFSFSWAERMPYKSWALCVNKYSCKNLIKKNIDKFSTIFIGSPDDQEWKWSKKNIRSWVKFAKNHKKSIHMGACGSFDKLLFCKSFGFDSVDSTNFVVNNNFEQIEKYLRHKNNSYFFEMY